MAMFIMKILLNAKAIEPHTLLLLFYKKRDLETLIGKIGLIKGTMDLFVRGMT